MPASQPLNTAPHPNKEASKWVVVKIMVPFWIHFILRHLIFRVPTKGRQINFDNHPNGNNDITRCSPLNCNSVGNVLHEVVVRSLLEGRDHHSCAGLRVLVLWQMLELRWVDGILHHEGSSKCCSSEGVRFMKWCKISPTRLMTSLCRRAWLG